MTVPASEQAGYGMGGKLWCCLVQVDPRYKVIVKLQYLNPMASPPQTYCNSVGCCVVGPIFPRKDLPGVLSGMWSTGGGKELSLPSFKATSWC